MTPLMSAFAAASWLAVVSAFFWWQRALQVAHERRLVYAPARQQTAKSRAARHAVA